MIRNEFKPPSDFVADDGGGKSSIWKWLGIGCAVIVLIIGGLLAAGTWKTVSCCSGVMDSARLTMKAGEFSTEFAMDLAQGNVEAARAKMTEDLQAKISADQLRAKLAEHERLLGASQARMSDVSINKSGADAPTVWNLTVEFAPPAGKTKLVVLTQVVSRGEGDEQQFLVDDLRFEERSRDIASEPPAAEVLDFHRQLRDGNYEQAYRSMSDGFSQDSDIEAFRQFIRDQQEVFRTGRVEIQSVAYTDDGSAKVVAQVSDGQDQRAQIDYELVRPNRGLPQWRIAGVTPIYELAETPPEDTESADVGVEESGDDVGGGEPDASSD